MSRSWVVMFDDEGIDTLIPWTDVKEENIIAKLSGDQGIDSRQLVARTILRAQLNNHRNTEIWGFDTAEDMSVDTMIELWKHENIEPLKELVRSKGNKLY